MYAHPDVSYTSVVKLETNTIDSLASNGIIPSNIDFLVLDVQGAELRILQGAEIFLRKNCLLGCQVETSVVPLYEDGSTYLQIGNLLERHGLHLKQIGFNHNGWADALFLQPYWPQPLSSDDWRLIDVLRPKKSPVSLVRVGGTGDGAYLIPNDLVGIKACYSPGVNNRKDFEDELLMNYGIDCHMCDYSSDPRNFKTPLKTGQTFKKKWLSVSKGEDNISLNDWISELTPDKSDDLILQMDIEGAEYQNIINTDESILTRFRIIVIELHGLRGCNSKSTFDQNIGPLLNKLDKHFKYIHLHPNNCSKEFVLTGSELNLCDIMEVTFLRRDRWGLIPEEDWHLPMLPHPNDISFNVPDEPPIFMNENWLSEGTRDPQSIIKMMTDKLDFAERELNLANTLSASLYKIANYAASMIASNECHSSSDDLVEVAGGKSYILSSAHDSNSLTGLIKERKPFFFHTGKGVNQSITIDLEYFFQLIELRISNRSDMCQERSRFLCYCIHNEQTPDLNNGIPIPVSDDFLITNPKDLIIQLRGEIGRYITIYSPQATMLHFASIEVDGIKVNII